MQFCVAMEIMFGFGYVYVMFRTFGNGWR